jgi:hypothetical protein
LFIIDGKQGKQRRCAGIIQQPAHKFRFLVLAERPAFNTQHLI